MRESQKGGQCGKEMWRGGNWSKHKREGRREGNQA